MCWMRRRVRLAKNTTPKLTHTTAIRMSMNHSGSAYSLLWVIPSGIVTIASTQISCQPQKVNSASLPSASRAWPVRCTT
jgi:hypothetical protein